MKLKLSTIGATLRAIPRLVAELNSREFVGPNDFTPEDFETTFSTTMTTANVVINSARAFTVGDMGWFNVHITFDITAAAADRVYFTVPFSLYTSTPNGDQTFPVAIYNAGWQSGVAMRGGGEDIIQVFRRDGAAWAVANGNEVRVNGWVEVQ